MVNDEALEPNHFSYLSKEYFMSIRTVCKYGKVKVWPIKNIYLGIKGQNYHENMKEGKVVRPNWMIEDEKGEFYIYKSDRLIKDKYNMSNVQKISYEEISKHFKLDNKIN